MKAFEGAIHLAKEATENIFTKVEETAVSVIASTILGTDERIVTESEAKPEVKQEAETGKSEGQKTEEAPAQEKVNVQESKAQTGKATATETDVPRERENEIKRLQSELEGFKERYSLLSHKLAEVQRESKDEVEKITQQLVENGMKLEEERRIFGREIVALTDQVIAERNRSAKEKELMDVEWKSLQMQIQKWEEIVTERELENFQLRKQVKEKETELQKLREEIAKKSAEKKEKKAKEWPKEGKFSESLKPQQTETKWEKPAEQLPTKEQPKEAEFSQNLKPEQAEIKWEKPAEKLSTEEKPKEGAFSENLKPEQAEAWEKPAEKLPTEEQTKEAEFSESIQTLGEHEEAVEHPLSQEDIQKKLSHKAVPAVRAGGKRIKQNQTGPHVFHKTSLVEQRDDKKLLEAFRESPEEMSKQLQAIEATQELEMKLVKRDVKIAGKKPTETKLFASTYFPPVPKNDDNQKIATGGINTYTVPMHGHVR